MKNKLIKAFVLIMIMSHAMTATAQEYISNNELTNLWRNSTIKVRGGGEKPDIITLLQAFNSKFRTWAGTEVLRRAPKLKDGGQYEDEDDYRVLVDRRNGYVDIATQTDGDEIQACVWKRKNGHRLFAVNLMETHEAVTNLVCWYDYDPKTETMTPETNAIDKWLSRHNPAVNGADLPMHGTEVTVYEPNAGLPTVTHKYKWDGMTHAYSGTSIEDFQFCSFGENDGERQRASEQGWTHYAIVDLKGNGDPTIWFSKSGGKHDYNVLDDYKGRINIIGRYCDGNPPGTYYISFHSIITGSDASRQIVVKTRDQVGGFCYTILNSEREPFFILDLPNYADGTGKSTRQIEGFGTDDENDQVLYKPAETFTPEPVWKKFSFMEEMPD